MKRRPAPPPRLCEALRPALEPHLRRGPPQRILLALLHVNNAIESRLARHDNEILAPRLEFFALGDDRFAPFVEILPADFNFLAALVDATEIGRDPLRLRRGAFPGGEVLLKEAFHGAEVVNVRSG